MYDFVALARKTLLYGLFWIGNETPRCIKCANILNSWATNSFLRRTAPWISLLHYTMKINRVAPWGKNT
jgi:hypothetical protein